ncbi:hypothetical protein [Bombilactobacillus bombi]|uniref:hypothetical protein n=1 Tax=Bombilactobacillus bombi TaxID=1303590 RepID=UPI0035ED5582
MNEIKKLNLLLTWQFWLKKCFETLISLIKIGLWNLILDFSILFLAGKINDYLLCFFIFIAMYFITYFSSRKITKIWNLWG